MSATLSLTLAEAGYVVGQSSAALNRAVDRGVIRARLERRGKARLRRIGAPELRFLTVAGALEKDLTPAGRRRLYEAIRHLPPDDHRVELGPLVISLDDVDCRIEERLRRLEEVKGSVDDAAGPEPLIRGTTVPVYVIAGLSQGQTVEEILEDYPSLKRQQVEDAIEYAKVHPKTGRPYPPRSFIRMLGDLAASGFFDDIEADEPEEMAPRLVP